MGTGPLPLSDRGEAEIGTWGRTPRGSGSFQAAPSRLHGQIHRAGVNCSPLSAHRESREGAGERWTGTAQPSGPLPVRPLLPGLPPPPGPFCPWSSRPPRRSRSEHRGEGRRGHSHCFPFLCTFLFQQNKTSTHPPATTHTRCCV